MVWAGVAKLAARTRLKIAGPKGRAGSTPASGTIQERSIGVISRFLVLLSSLALAGGSSAMGAQTAPVQEPSGIQTPDDYVIGPGDVLDVVFWKDDQSSTKDVRVQSDGKVMLSGRALGVREVKGNRDYPSGQGGQSYHVQIQLMTTRKGAGT